ncbi:UbiA family prenyltransferase [Yersinia frederiksenii]|uniref:Polyprenyltransferase (Cytochrome oxidase assembly factor) n=1 Tax=Yersinia frederiksenii TaxID=29484 RepID=A0AAI8ZQ07_YERFR|nr:UbiA family prenyltransferase [Yersinia frederiksenii]CFQ96101.1 Polyprenyltransferase (cytochrome oxidase assembly factor) [Yersinia frederiksenii]
MNSMGTPLCIDLDGTLVRTDTLVESFFLLIKKNPFYAFLCVLWLLRGKASLKNEIAKRVTMNASSLPYNESLLDMLHNEHRNGREIWLCTAANEKIAQSVSDHLGIFSKVIASNNTKNVSSSVKADEILSHTDSFDYAGNSSDDIKVWDKSTGAIVVDLPKKLMNKVSVPILYQFDSDKKTIKAWLKEIRIHQWAKNILIFIPILAAHEISKSSLLLDAMLAFIAFGFCASSVYLLNDLVDLEADREHKIKRNRPLASGAIPLIHGIIAAVILFILAIIITLYLPIQFAFALASYYVITLAYSFSLKSKVVIDVATLAILYSMRLVAGAAATGIMLSNWLISFSMFIFFSLAIVKRVVELKSSESNAKIKGRGYYPADMPLLLASGISSGYISILVFVLYIDSSAGLQNYNNPDVLYFIAPILFVWLTRVWLLTWRGDMHDDPVAFAIKDRTSQLMGFVMAVLMILAAGV